MKTVFSLIFLLFTNSCLSFETLDEEAAKERKCFDVNVSKDIDWNWISSIEKWYYPMSSKLELYRTASAIFNKKISDIPESEMQFACITTDNKSNAYGFNKPAVTFNITENQDKSFYFKGPGKFAKSGTQYLTLSDNKNFVVGVTCWEDNEASWGIWSTASEINLGIKETVLEHLVSFGFSRDFAVEMFYDHCPQSFEGKQQHIYNNEL